MPESSSQCFRGSTISDVVNRLQARGAKCAPDGRDMRCVKPGASLRLWASLDAPGKITLATITTTAGGPDKYPQGKAVVIRNLRTSLTTLMPMLLPGQPGTQQRVKAFGQRDLGSCGSFDATTIDGYAVSCDPPQSIGVATQQKAVTSWSVAITVKVAHS